MSNTIRVGQATHSVSPLLFGLFLEDINFSCDGGLNSNLIANHSFDGLYWEPDFDLMSGMSGREPVELKDELRYWTVEGGSLVSCKENPLSVKNPFFGRVCADGKVTLSNMGYNGNRAHAGEPAMSIAEDKEYEISLFLRAVDFEGEVKVYAAKACGCPLTDAAVFSASKEWNKVCATVKATGTAYGKFVIEVEGKGTLDIDCAYFGDADTWGKDDPKWTGGRFRRDLVQALADLKPTFLRFPGGCIVEGHYPGNEYQWKNTVGPVQDRIPAVNLWAAAIPDKGYDQSYQIGFYEYFLLCEELKMEPLPIVWAGLTCQYRSTKVIPTDSPEFDEKVLQNALDLIEYAKGDPETSPWARLRAEAGHPEPFPLNMIGIGNENYGPDYVEKFTKVKAAIDAKYPGITCIMSGGGMPEGENIECTWEATRNGLGDVRVDEHFYMPEPWVYSQHKRYDNYDRNGAHVFLGEYAAVDLMALMLGGNEGGEVNEQIAASFEAAGANKPVNHGPNTYSSALSEAAFLTGIERNADVVDMTSYAPLFSLSEGNQWPHNLIVFNPKTYVQTTNYLVQMMYGQTQGTEVLEMIGELPEGVYGNITADAEKIYIKLVNANDAPVSVKVETGVCGKAKAWILQSDDLYARNTLDFHGDPVTPVLPVEEEVCCCEGAIDVELKKYSFYVFTVNK